METKTPANRALAVLDTAAPTEWSFRRSAGIVAPSTTPMKSAGSGMACHALSLRFEMLAIDRLLDGCARQVLRIADQRGLVVWYRAKALLNASDDR